MSNVHLEEPDRPWVMRTYAGHTSASATNELFRTNLSRGQTGLSVAFDLPTQLGYDPDAPLARGEVGKVGVPVSHLGDMRALFASLPLGKMNTSMTINATAPWLYSLYLTLARESNTPFGDLAGTTQNDVVKEYLSRGTFIFPPEASKRLTVDLIVHSVLNVPKWNPINICSYHLQEAGGTPVQEIAYSLATAMSVLDAVRARPEMGRATFQTAVGRVSFFLNAGLRFVEETAKVRAFSRLWSEICLDRYDIQDPTLRRFRYGVQVNSLGLTESQPENNVYRIMLEALSVTLSRSARARALQLPAWNEAIGLPRPFDQQWSLRAQQILAYETDLLEYPDIFDGSTVMEELTAEIAHAARRELTGIIEAGGVFSQVDHLKEELVRSQAIRTHARETGEQIVVGVNRFTQGEAGPFGAEDSLRQSGDAAYEERVVKNLVNWRQGRDNRAVGRAETALAKAAKEGQNVLPASLALAEAGGTTQEWADVLREVFGEFQGPTGVQGGAGHRRAHLSGVASKLERLGPPRPRFLVAKPGMDGHSNGAEQIAVAARDAGFEVIYHGIRQTPEDIAQVALDEDVHLIGLSLLSGSHLVLVPQILGELRLRHVNVPVILGGIIPPGDAELLVSQGVTRVYTPRDFRLIDIMDDLVNIVAQSRA